MFKKLLFSGVICFLKITSYTQCSVMTIDSLYSQNLEEYRKYAVYLPENFDSQNSYPIVFATDGQILIENDYKSLLDSLISSHLLPPLVLLGAFSNEKEVPPPAKGITYRQFEYVENFDNQRFEKHLQFFINEIPNMLQSKYRLSMDNKNTIFYGVSNGGGFGLTLFFRNINSFEYYICLSPVGYEKIKVGKNKNNRHFLYIAYGKEEYFFIHGFEKTVRLLEKKNYCFDKQVYDGGHDRKFWRWMFGKILITIFDK